MSENQYPRIQFRTVEGLHGDILKRAVEEKRLNETARRDLTRYYALLNDVYNMATNRLTVNEQMAVKEACPAMGLPAEQLAHSQPWLRIWVDKAIEEGTLKQWEVDEDQLLEKVRSFTTVEALALIDAAEHWWAISPAERLNNAQDLVQAGRLERRFLTCIK